VFQVVGCVAFLIPWSVYMVYLASSGDVVGSCVCPGSIDYNPTSFIDSGSSEEVSAKGSECRAPCATTPPLFLPGVVHAGER